MILNGKKIETWDSINDLSDIWIHDWNDDFGVHYGIDKSMYYDGSTYVGTTYRTDDHANYYDYNYKSFKESQNDYYDSEYYQNAHNKIGAHGKIEDPDTTEHPIIAVFEGKNYVWPTRSTHDITNVSRYIFKDYINESRNKITENDRIHNYDQFSHTFNIYIDSYQRYNKYKCVYYFTCSSWINVSLADNAPKGMNILTDEDGTGKTYTNGMIFWDYNIDSRNNKLTYVDKNGNEQYGVCITEENIVDSILKITVDANPYIYDRTGYIVFEKQYDQYRGMECGIPYGSSSSFFIYTINQKGDNIDFSGDDGTVNLVWYDNDNTMAKPMNGNCYGPMTSKGGVAWVHFKITGTSKLGTIRTFGEYDWQTHSLLWVSSTIVTTRTPIYNKYTGIWTIPVVWAEGESSQSTYSGDINVTVSPNECVGPEGGSAQLNASGVNASVQTQSPPRTAIIKVKLLYDSRYSGTPEGETCYTQNASKPETAPPATYNYSILGLAPDYVYVSQSGLVTWKVNNEESERNVTVRVTCNETGAYKDIVVCQSYYDYTIDPDQYPDCTNKPRIVFYSDDTASARANYNTYGILPGDGGEGTIYFKIIAINGNCKEKDWTGLDGINISSSSLTIQTNTLKINSSTNIYSCKVTAPSNAGSDSIITGNLTCLISDATCNEPSSTATVSVNGLSIYKGDDSTPVQKTHQITVTKDKLTGQCSYIQDAGTQGTIYHNITYKFEFVDEDDKQYIKDGGLPTNSNRQLIWKDNDSDESRTIKIKCTCVEDESKYVIVEATQYACFVPVTDDLQKIEWNLLIIYNDNTCQSELKQIPLNSNSYYEMPPFDCQGGSATVFFKIFGKATYAMSGEKNITWGADFPNECKKEKVSVTNSGTISLGSLSGTFNFSIKVSENNSSTTEKLVGKLSVSADSITVNGITSNAPSFNDCVYFYQNGCEPGVTPTYTYAGEWTSIEFSFNSDFSDSQTFTKNSTSPATFWIEATENPSDKPIYMRIWGKYYINGIEQGTVLWENGWANTNIKASHASGEIDLSNFSAYNTLNNQAIISFKGASGTFTDNNKDGIFSFNIKCQYMNTPVKNIDDVSEWNAVNALKVIKKATNIQEEYKFDENEPPYVVWHKTSTDSTDIGTTYYINYCQSNNKNLYFTIYRKKYLYINNVKQDDYTLEIQKVNASSLEAKPLQNMNGSSQTITIISGPDANGNYNTEFKYEYSNSENKTNIPMVGTQIYWDWNGDGVKESLNKTMTIYNDYCAPNTTCTLGFYVAKNNDDAYTYLYFNKNVGDIIESNMSTSNNSCICPELTVCIKSEKGGIKNTPIVLYHNTQISVFETNDYYYFTTTKGSTSDIEYVIDNGCKTIKLTIKGYDPQAVCVTTWYDVEWYVQPDKQQNYIIISPCEEECTIYCKISGEEICKKGGTQISKKTVYLDTSNKLTITSNSGTIEYSPYNNEYYKIRCYNFGVNNDTSNTRIITVTVDYKDIALEHVSFGIRQEHYDYYPIITW